MEHMVLNGNPVLPSGLTARVHTVEDNSCINAEYNGVDFMVDGRWTGSFNAMLPLAMVRRIAASFNALRDIPLEEIEIAAK